MTWQPNQVRGSTVQRKKKPYLLTPMYLLVIREGGVGNYKKDLKVNRDVLVGISPTVRI